MNTLQIVYNATKKCACVTGSYVDIVREHFSVENKGAFFAKKHGHYNIPSRKYIITSAGNVGIGLIPRIIAFCNEKNIPYVVDEQLNSILKPTIYNGILHTVQNTDFKLYNYQQDAVLNTLKQGRGILHIGTGGGKTLITSTIIENFYQYSKNKETFKCLVIVPDLGLVTQTYDEFNKFKVSFSTTKFTGSNQPDLTSNCIIANSQILLHLDAHDKWINDIDLLIVDEVHKIKKNNKITKLISKIKTIHRIGCTGTLPVDLLDLWGIISSFGDVVFVKPSSELRNESFLTSVVTRMLHLQYSDNISRTYAEELEFLMNHNGRNSIIYKICSKCSHNVLILVNNIKHGEILLDILNSLTNKQVYFVRGSVEVEDRAKIIKYMETSDNVVCIAISAIFSTGINIKNLQVIVFAAGGKSSIRIIQSIGRGLRLHPDKKQCVIMDLADNLKYGNAHANARKKIYESEKIPYNVSEIIVES